MELVFEDFGASAPELHFTTRELASKNTGLSSREFSGSPGSVVVLREGGRVVVWAGLGGSAGVEEDTLRRAAGTAARKLAAAGRRSLMVDAGAYGCYARAIVEGAALGAYHFNSYKSGEREETGLERIALIGLDAQEQLWARDGAAMAGALNRVRDLGNTPPNIMTPVAVASAAEEYVRRTGATLRVWDEYDLGMEGFGGILAVGSGSANPPRFILLEREVDPAWPTVALVGKTITFDSGGISIKSAKGMEEEKLDKMGGLAALGVLEAVTVLRIPVNMIVVLCAAENMPGNNACRPSDVITTYGGTTVEIIDTDAEGRIVMADGLAYVDRHFKPNLTIDIATLTGACCVALGMERAGLFTSDDELADVFSHAGRTSGDKCWRLPLGEEFSKEMESRVADLRNAGTSRWGGASKAAAFLQRFKGEGQWVHIDIAGSGMPDADLPHMERGATGAGVRLVAEALRGLYGRLDQ
jgi:leucyl aminopeptidase